MTGMQRYLKRCTQIFAAFQKKQKAQKAKIKGPADHGYFAKPKSNYRKNRDLEICKTFIKFKSSIKQTMIKIWPGSHPFYSDETCEKYVLKCVKRARTRNGAKIYAAGAKL